jgi:hypothetical protein
MFWFIATEILLLGIKVSYIHFQDTRSVCGLYHNWVRHLNKGLLMLAENIMFMGITKCDQKTRILANSKERPNCASTRQSNKHQANK